jgi:hypothetical protein
MERAMMELNPYAKYLDGRPLEQILSATPAAVSALLEAMGAAEAEAAPVPGKWSPAKIVAHLADCDLAFGFRMRQTLAETDHVVQPFDQDLWAATYDGITAGQALAAFVALRQWNLILIARALPVHGDKTVIHPERGTMTFRTIVETMAGHDLNHLVQLKAIAER